MPTYIFKVKLAHQKRTYREIEILGEQTLDDLHYAIFKAFKFEEMHLYSFFMSGKAWDSETEYTSSHSLKEMGENMARAAAKTKIESLNLQPKQKFLYLFDFGDCRRFEVEFLANGHVEDRVKYPRIIKIAAEAPQQYG